MRGLPFKPRGALVGVVGITAIAGFGCGGATDNAKVVTSGTWRNVPTAPLTPRDGAVGVWTGREVLVIGGSDAPPEPDGSNRRSPLRDGAAFNPRTREWRRVADAPIGVDFATAVLVDRTVFVAVPDDPAHRRTTQTHLLAYKIDGDRWDRIASPPRRGYALVATDKRLIAFGGKAARGRRARAPGFVLMPRTRSWRAIAPDPLPRDLPRGLYWNGRRLVLISAAGATTKPLARAATLRLGATRWRMLPDADDVLYGRLYWVRVGSRLVSPSLGDGGDRYRWGLPFGGILDPETGTWSQLPNVPPAGIGPRGTGVLTAHQGSYSAPTGLILDMTRNRWIRIARPPRRLGRGGGWTVLGARRDLFAFGGIAFDAGDVGARLSNEAWVWTPPRAQ